MVQARVNRVLREGYSVVVPRKQRSDRKHRFQSRLSLSVWRSLQELSINCGGIESGASLNSLVEQLLSLALESQEILAMIVSRYPEPVEVIKFRNWGRS